MGIGRGLLAGIGLAALCACSAGPGTQNRQGGLPADIRTLAALPGSASFGAAVSDSPPMAVVAAAPRPKAASEGPTTAFHLVVIDTLTSKVVREIPLPYRPETPSLSLLPGSRILVQTTAAHRGMDLWDLDSGTLLRRVENAMGPSALLPGTSIVVYADQDKLRLYDAVADREVSAPFPHGGDSITRLAVSADGTKVATLTVAGTLRVWTVRFLDREKTYILSPLGARDATLDRQRARALSFSHSGEWVYTLSEDRQGVTILSRWSAERLERMENLPLGTRMRSDQLVRLPGRDVFVTTASGATDSYVVFIDPSARSAALVDSERNFRPAVAASDDPGNVFTASARELKRVAVPAPAAFQSFELAFLPLQPLAQPTTPSPTPVPGPLITNVPADAMIQAVSVYEGGGGLSEELRTAQGMRRARSVDLHVGKTERPLMLVLASYEPVIWNVKASRDARITHVFLTGYYESVVRGLRNAQVNTLSTPFSYPTRPADLEKLNEQLTSFTGKRVQGVQSTYRGVRFYFGVDAPPAAGETPEAAARHLEEEGIVGGGLNKCVDASGKVIYRELPCARFGLKQGGVVRDPDEVRKIQDADPNIVTMTCEPRAGEAKCRPRSEADAEKLRSRDPSPARRPREPAPR